MGRRKNLTLNDIPLYATDEQIGEVVLGYERRKEFKGKATSQQRYGMPPVDPLWGGRYVPAVKHFFDWQYGLVDRSRAVMAPSGVEGKFEPGKRGHRPKPSEPASDFNDPRNRREFYRRGKVRVHMHAGGSFIDDAKPTDPESWQKGYEPKPDPTKIKKRKLTPRTPPPSDSDISTPTTDGSSGAFPPSKD